MRVHVRIHSCVCACVHVCLCVDVCVCVLCRQSISAPRRFFSFNVADYLCNCQLLQTPAEWCKTVRTTKYGLRDYEYD